MKKLYIIIFLFVFALVADAQIPNWAWAKKGSGTSLEIGNCTTTDVFGNVFVTGYFNSSPVNFGSFGLTTVGGFDIFLVKYDASGNVLWAKSAGGTSHDYSYSLTTDSSGAVYIAGSFQSNAITFGNTTLTNAGIGYNDMFVAKYDSSGNVLWAKRAGGTDNDAVVSVTTASGSVYVAGNFKSTSFVFNSDTITNTSFGYSQIFLARYDTSGNEQWGISEGGVFDNTAFALTSDRAGNIYATGNYNPSITFGSTTLTNTNGSHIFLAKYNASGNFIWARSDGGDGSDIPNCISTDAACNIFMTGWFNGSYTAFGSTTLTNANMGAADLFIAKFDSSGTPLWAKRAGGANNEISFGVCADTSGSAVITGNFVSPTITFGSFTLTNGGALDMFVAKYDASGNVLWAKRAGGAYGDYGQSVVINASGNVYVAGYFDSPSIVFGSTTLTNINPGGDDVFLAKLDITTGMSESFDGAAVSIYPNPTCGKFNIEAKGEITIFNLSGEKIYSEQLISNKTEIDLSEIAKGIYLAKITTAEKTYSQKIIIL